MVNKLKFSAGDRVDGEWVDKSMYINPAALTGGGTYVIDLVGTGYLPDDKYDYEVLISCYMWTNTTNGNNGSIWLYNADSAKDGVMRVTLCYSRNRQANSTVQCASCIFPLLNNVKKICFKNTTNNLSSWGVDFTGYRRLGTNE